MSRDDYNDHTVPEATPNARRPTLYRTRQNVTAFGTILALKC